MKKENVYVIDANAFLTPSKNYYRFNIAPSYWKQFNELSEAGYIKTIDKVAKELKPKTKEKFKDDIQLWYEDEFKGEIISTNTQEIFNEYQSIIQFLNDSVKYSEKAFLEWAQHADVADPWLIATAKVNDYTIVTFEGRINYNGGSPMGKATIPNVCEDLIVPYTDLFRMMEHLKITL